MEYGCKLFSFIFYVYLYYKNMGLSKAGIFYMKHLESKILIIESLF